MKAGRIIARLSREPGPFDYLLAIILAVVAIAFRSIINLAVPGVAYFILLFPALVIAGVFLGTGPALVAAAMGGSAAAVLLLGAPLVAWPPFNASQIDVVLFIPACAAVIWSTHTLRRSAVIASSAEARLLEVFRQIPGAAAILEAPDGRLIMSSSQSDAVLGHSPRMESGAEDMRAYGGLHPDGRAYRAEEYPIVRALRSGEIVQAERLLYQRPDGRVIDLDVYAGPVLDQEDRIVASVGMALDVSERVAAERRLAESEALHRAAAGRLRAAIDAGAMGLWEMDLATGVISLDATIAGMLGMPAKPVDVPRETLRGFVVPEDRARSEAALTGAITQGGPYADELHLHTVQGDDRWLITRGAILADVGKAVGVVTDITGRRQREDALAAALHARDVLMHEADHRIKNSLQLVVSLLGLQLRRVADPDAKHALEAAISRVEAIATAHLALQTSPDLRSVEIDVVLEQLSERLGSLNPAVAIRCDMRSGLVMDADRAIPLGLIVSELLTNALRHAYPPGVSGTAGIATERVGDMLQVTVADSGRGIPTSPARQGLGTTLVTALTRQVGATIESTSQLGEGTAIVLRLRLAA